MSSLSGTKWVILSIMAPYAIGCANQQSRISLSGAALSLQGEARTDRERACAGGTWAMVEEEKGTSFAGVGTSSRRQFREMLFFCCPNPNSEPTCHRAKWQDEPATTAVPTPSETRSTASTGQVATGNEQTSTSAPAPAGAILTRRASFANLPARDLVSVRQRIGQQVTLGVASGRSTSGVLKELDESKIVLQREGASGPELASFPWAEVDWLK